MATQTAFLEADTPINVVSEFSLTNGKTYLLQVVGGTSVRMLEKIGSTPPDINLSAHQIRPLHTWAIMPKSESIFIWSRYNGSAVAITETE